MTPEKEIQALSDYIRQNWNHLALPGVETERLQYLRTKILIIKNENTPRPTKNMA